MVWGGGGMAPRLPPPLNPPLIGGDSTCTFPIYYQFATYTVCVTGCDIEKSVFAKIVQITSYVRSPIHV